LFYSDERQPGREVIMATAIVTGGSKGLGLALSHALVELGWDVVIDGRHAEVVEAAVAELGRQATGVLGDVAHETHRHALLEAAMATGPLELLVNNASSLGPLPMPGLDRYPLDGWRATFEVNVVAPLALIQLALPTLVARRGRIINVTSDAGIEGYEGWGGYGASKAALEQLSRVLAAEHPELVVYWVDPGDMRTDMHQDAFPGEDISDRPPPSASVPGLLALVLGELPSGRYTAREIATVTS
jgi:NAD(P)-dependent dehydrogenase (short-subunit alcohol dehydrogenase family)